LFLYLLCLLLEREIGEGDAEDKAKDKDDGASDGDIDNGLPGQRIIFFSKPGIIYQLTDPGLQKANGRQQHDRGKDIPSDAARPVQPGKEKTDIAIDDYCIHQGIQDSVDKGLEQSIHGQVGKEIDEEDGSPDQPLQLSRACSPAKELGKDIHRSKLLRIRPKKGLFSTIRLSSSMTGVLKNRAAGLNAVAARQGYVEICAFIKTIHMRALYYITLLLIHLLIAAISRGQTADTIRPGKGHLLTTVLKPGLRQYLVYFQNPQHSDRLGFWYWLRDISIETRNGVKYFAITQHWYGGDSTAYRKVYSLNAMDDFAPAYHSETVRGHTRSYH